MRPAPAGGDAARLDRGITNTVSAFRGPRPWRRCGRNCPRSTDGFEEAADFARRALESTARDVAARACQATPSLALAVALDLLGDGPIAAASRCRAAMSPVPRWGPPLMQFFGALRSSAEAIGTTPWPRSTPTLSPPTRPTWAWRSSGPSPSARRSPRPGRTFEAQTWLDEARESTRNREPLGGEWLILARAWPLEAGGAGGPGHRSCRAAHRRGRPRPAQPGGASYGRPQLVRLASRAGRGDLARRSPTSWRAAGRTWFPLPPGSRLGGRAGGRRRGQHRRGRRHPGRDRPPAPRGAWAHHHAAVVAARAVTTTPGPGMGGRGARRRTTPSTRPTGASNCCPVLSTAGPGAAAPAPPGPAGHRLGQPDRVRSRHRRPRRAGAHRTRRSPSTSTCRAAPSNPTCRGSTPS